MAQLRRLHELVPEVIRWHHSLAVVDSTGRLLLPVHARPGDDEPPELLATSGERALILRRTGLGSRRRVDRRGRLLVPYWLRDLVGDSGEVIVSVGVPDAAVVVVAPVAVLDDLADALAGEGR